MKEKILVTGGAGYIGSHTVVELVNRDYEVVIIDNLSNSEESVMDGVEKITGTRPDLAVFDLCDAEKLDLFFKGHPDIRAIIHFAASKAVGESVAQPLLYYRNNLVSLINLLAQCARSGVAGMVFSSSCTVYGQPDELPVSEEAPIKEALSPYGNTKQISEEILCDYLAAHPDFATISLRYFNPIGAHPSALIGELPRGVPNNLVPFITQTAIGLRECLQVFGNDYPTPDGSCIRDYIHVVDLAAAHVVATERLLRGQMLSPMETFNLGTGRGTSVLECIESFERVSGEKLNYTVAPRRPGDVEQVYADTRKANEVLGWRATRGLDEMMASAWAWEKHLREQRA